MGPRRLAVFRASEGWRPGPDLEIPRGTRRVALHPALDRAAVLRPGRIELLPWGAGTLPGPSTRAWMRPSRSLGFDSTGQGLWLSEEVGGVRSVNVIDTASLSDVASASGVVAAPVNEEVDDLHEWLPHPSAPAMGLSVSCGQDGTWLTFFQREAEGLRRLGGLEAVDAPFFPAGFTPDGGSFLGIGGTWVRRWSFPACELLAEFSLPEFGDLATGYAGLVTERSVFVTVEDLRGEGEWQLHELETGSLRPVGTWSLPISNDAFPTLHLLPGGFLVAEGGQLWRLPARVLGVPGTT